jgi:transcriptional regulator with XRE-family HTH domain
MQPVQVKMARAALGLSIDELAKQAGVSAPALAALEQGGGAEPQTTQGLSLYFAANGIELIDSDGVRAQARQAAEFVTVDQLTTGNDGGEG